MFEQISILLLSSILVRRVVPLKAPSCTPVGSTIFSSFPRDTLERAEMVLGYSSDLLALPHLKLVLLVSVLSGSRRSKCSVGRELELSASIFHPLSP